MSNKNRNTVEVPTLKLIQQIKNKTLSPKLVSREIRPSMVGYLILDGWSRTQIAQLFECSERTVRRYVEDFEETNKISTSPEFVRKKAGYFVVASENQIAALLRIARSPNTSNPERIAAEVSAWKIRVDTLTKLQDLGFLPTHTHQIDLYHHSDGEESLEEVKAKIVSIENIAQECGNLSPEIAGKINKLKLKIEKIEAQDIAIKLLEEQKSKLNEKEETDE